MNPLLRRRFLKSAGALALSTIGPGTRAASDIPIADSHNHVGLFSKKLVGHTLKAQMEEAGLTLLAWTIASDALWTHRVPSGIEQRAVPGPGEQSKYVLERLSWMRNYLAKAGVGIVRDVADIDAARSGKPRVVIAVEGAGFLEDGMELLDKAYAQGLRHLQLVHYIKSALGDFQTERPIHDGLTDLGVKAIQSCNRLGILVDLAHCTNADMDRALEASNVPMIWSHSAVTNGRYSWAQASNLSRLLNIDYAKKIAQRGGAVGLWALRSTVRSSPEGYANELMRMVDELGPEHVMFGTDIDGLGTFGVMEELTDLRKVADVLQQHRVDDATLKAICFENYARCLKAAMLAAKPAA